MYNDLFRIRRNTEYVTKKQTKATTYIDLETKAKFQMICKDKGIAESSCIRKLIDRFIEDNYDRS